MSSSREHARSRRALVLIAVCGVLLAACDASDFPFGRSSEGSAIGPITIEDGGLLVDGGGMLWTWGEVEPVGVADPSTITQPCGSNDSCVLGLAPAPTGGMVLPIVDVSMPSGSDDVIGIDSEGHLWAWQDDDYYDALDDPATIELLTQGPVPVVGPSDAVVFTEVDSGEYVHLALDADGQVWSWGRSPFGGLGIAGQDALDQPTLVAFPYAAGPIIAISAWDYHTLALDANGQAWAWGLDEYGQVGNPAAAHEEFDMGSYTELGVPTPVAVDQSALPTPVVAIAAGAGYSIALDREGRAWAWGDNDYGTLGTEDDDSDALSPTPVDTSDMTQPLVSISASAYTVVAVDSAGDVWLWGITPPCEPFDTSEPSYGWVSSPTELDTDQVPGKVIEAFSLGSSAFLVNDQGNVWVWGKDLSGLAPDGHPVGNGENDFPEQMRCYSPAAQLTFVGSLN